MENIRKTSKGHLD